MSSHAGTIRNALVAPMPSGWGTNDPEKALDALLAENQRLREALTEIDVYINDLAYPGPETRWIEAIVREALAGDAE